MNADATTAGLAGVLKTVWSSDKTAAGLYARSPLLDTKEQRPMSHEYDFVTGKPRTLDEQIAEADWYAKDLRKKAKAAAKVERARKAAAKERARVRKLALDALEKAALGGDVKAAVKLLDRA